MDSDDAGEEAEFEDFGMGGGGGSGGGGRGGGGGGGKKGGKKVATIRGGATGTDPASVVGGRVLSWVQVRLHEHTLISCILCHCDSFFRSISPSLSSTLSLKLSLSTPLSTLPLTHT